ncbi:hypothetical protein GCM10007231_13410 [Nocardioides daphniae]|uniref:Secreted protein n=1 Tax=Nocardioides daphniae TaxID=402297 RepID=A0ABQ1Q896_9ACTN|nr:hypothetical protein GCM10007231_13410 [Nocardioides daphniae]
MTKFVAVAAASVVVTLGAGLGSAAQADSSGYLALQKSDGSYYRAGSVSFDSDSTTSPEREVFSVTDNAADGYGIRMEWKTAAKSNSCTNSHGSGRAILCSYDLLENRDIQYRICAVDYVNGAYRTIKCGGWWSDRT